MKGVMGAISLVTVSRACDNVAKAAAPSGVDGPLQNLGRDLRTYQFDTSSMKAAIRRPAAAESNASIAIVTSRTTRFSSLSSHRSSGGRSAGGGGSASARPVVSVGASAPAALAYKTRNEAVFQYVSSTLRTMSSRTPDPILRVAHGEPETAKNQRTVSAP